MIRRVYRMVCTQCGRQLATRETEFCGGESMWESAAEARSAAKDEGWIKCTVNGITWDVCPRCREDD